MKLTPLLLSLSLTSALLADEQALEAQVVKLEERIAKIEKLISASTTPVNQHPIVGKWIEAKNNGYTMDFRSDNTLIATSASVTTVGTYKVLEGGNIQVKVKGEDEATVAKAEFEGSLVTLSEVDGNKTQVFYKSK